MPAALSHLSFLPAGQPASRPAPLLPPTPCLPSPGTSLTFLPALRVFPLQAALHAAKSDKAALPRAAKKAEALLRQLVDITLRTDLTRIQRTNLETCITVHMHQKEVGFGGQGAHWLRPWGGSGSPGIKRDEGCLRLC